MPAPARRYQTAVHYLQYKFSALEAITRAGRDLKAAYVAVVTGQGAIPLLERARAAVDVALREARGMANMDDATVTGEPAA